MAFNSTSYLIKRQNFGVLELTRERRNGCLPLARCLQLRQRLVLFQIYCVPFYVHALDADIGVAFCKETQFLCLQIRRICFNKFIGEFCFAKSYSVVTLEIFVSLTFLLLQCSLMKDRIFDVWLILSMPPHLISCLIMPQQTQPAFVGGTGTYIERHSPFSIHVLLYATMCTGEMLFCIFC